MADELASLWRALVGTEPLTGAGKETAEAYAGATARLLAERVPLAAGVFLFFIGNATVLEWWFFPGRHSALLAVCLAELSVCCAHVIIVRQQPSWVRPLTILASVALVTCMSWYFATVDGNAEMHAVELALFLGMTGVVYPWGARGQALAGAGTILSYLLALAGGLVAELPILYGLFALVSAALVTALGAGLLDQHRLSAFRHAAELQQANARQRQETELSNALLSLSQSLNATLNDPRATAEQLNNHTLKALGLDWTLTSLLDESRQVFRTVAATGPYLEVVAEVRAVEVERGSMPLHAALEREGLVEIADRDRQELIPRSLMERWRGRSALACAIAREGDLIGILMGGYVERRGPFSDTQRRLLRGFAQQAAVALENARLIETAREANRIKSEFVATVSHELRTPLNVILGYTDLLADGTLGTLTAEQQDALARVRSRSLHLLDLIQDILDVNRLESGRVPLTIEDFSIGELLRSIRTAVPSSWRRPAVQLDFDGSHDHLVVRSDRAKVEMVIRNLVHNALKYTERGVVAVRVATRPSAGAVEIAVSDTGPGISEEDLPRIFEMFRQGNGASRSSEGGGVGLGLYIVRRLIEALGGSVSVLSEVGHGSRFSVTLPVEPAPAIALRDASE
jgi:signal transduction histidine kinase